MSLTSFVLLYIAFVDVLVITQLIIYAPFQLVTHTNLETHSSTLDLYIGIFLCSYPCGLLIGWQFINKLAETFGRKFCFILTLTVYIVALMICMFSHSIYHCVFAFFVMGAFGSLWNNVIGCIRESSKHSEFDENSTLLGFLTRNEDKMFWFLQTAYGCGCIVAGFFGNFYVLANNSPSVAHSHAAPMTISIVLCFFALCFVQILFTHATDIDIEEMISAPPLVTFGPLSDEIQMDLTSPNGGNTPDSDNAGAPMIEPMIETPHNNAEMGGSTLNGPHSVEEPLLNSHRTHPNALSTDNTQDLINECLSSKLFRCLLVATLLLWILILSIDVIFPVFASISSNHGGMGWDAQYVGFFYLLYSAVWLMVVWYRWYQLRFGNAGATQRLSLSGNPVTSIKVACVLLLLIYGIIFPWCINSPSVHHAEWKPSSWLILGMIVAALFGILAASISFDIAQLFKQWRHIHSVLTISETITDTAVSDTSIMAGNIGGNIGGNNGAIASNIGLTRKIALLQQPVDNILSQCYMFARIFTPIVLQLLYVIGLHVNSQLTSSHLHTRREWYQIGNFAFYTLACLSAVVYICMFLYDRWRSQALGEDEEAQEMSRVIEEIRLQRMRRRTAIISDSIGNCVEFNFMVALRGCVTPNHAFELLNFGAIKKQISSSIHTVTSRAEDYAGY